MKIKTIMGSVLITLIFMVGTVFSSNGQVSATAATYANVITPISISKDVDLNFGNLIVGSTSGTVILAPTSTGTRTSSGGVSLPVTTGTVTAAKFTVTGVGASTYSITLPTTVNLTYNGWVIIASAFKSTPSGTGALTGGTQDIYVGATLTLGANQLPGAYTNASNLLVTVNYN